MENKQQKRLSNLFKAMQELDGTQTQMSVPESLTRCYSVPALSYLY